jgi:DnaJ domain
MQCFLYFYLGKQDATMEFDPYKVLKVDPSADIEIITAAYKALSKKFHPDVNKSPDAVAKMQEINRAYDSLKDPAERAKIDADLAKQRTTTNRPNFNQSPNQGWGGYSRQNPPPPPPNSNQPSNHPFQGIGDTIRKTWETVTSPPKQQANSDTYFLYQKRLVDDNQNKVFRVSTYQDRLHGKICNLYVSSPDARGRIQTGSVFLSALETFDLLEAIGEALAAINNPTSPIEMNTEHDTYFRRIIKGMNSTFVAVEVVKFTRDKEKTCLLSLGERGNSANGVASPQNEKQLRQIQRIIQEALDSIMPTRR